MEGVLYYQEIQTARDAADLQKAQIREQQVSLRLQENQGDIARQQQLRQVLATEQVQMGVRNIAPTSGTIKAITQQNFTNYLHDEMADKLNYMAKQQALGIQTKQTDVQKRAQEINSSANFLNQAEKIVATVATAGMGGGAGAGGVSGAGAGAGFGSASMANDPSLLDYGSNMNLNG